MSPSESLLRAASSALGRGDRERARTLATRAIRWEDDGQPHLLLGRIHLLEREWEAAEAALRTSLERGWFTSEVYYLLGISMAEQGAYVLAATSYRYAIEVGGEKCSWAARARQELIDVVLRPGNRRPRSVVPPQTPQFLAAG